MAQFSKEPHSHPLPVDAARAFFRRMGKARNGGELGAVETAKKASTVKQKEIITPPPIVWSVPAD